MSDHTSPWAGRRVLVTGGTEPLGAAVVRELLAAGAGVVGLVPDRTAAAALTRDTPTGRAWAVHGRADDLFRVYSALAVHEVGAVFHLTPPDPRATAAVVEAVRRYDPRTPVVLARPSGIVDPSPTRGGEEEPSRLVWSPLPASGRGLGGGVLAPPVPLGVVRFDDVFGPAAHGLRDFGPVADAARACVRLAERLLERPVPDLIDLPLAPRRAAA